MYVRILRIKDFLEHLYMGLHGLLLASLNVEKKSFFDEEKKNVKASQGKAMRI
jgi:hypothetical protein